MTKNVLIFAVFYFLIQSPITHAQVDEYMGPDVEVAIIENTSDWEKLVIKCITPKDCSKLVVVSHFKGHVEPLNTIDLSLHDRDYIKIKGSNTNLFKINKSLKGASKLVFIAYADAIRSITNFSVHTSYSGEQFLMFILQGYAVSVSATSVTLPPAGAIVYTLGKLSTIPELPLIALKYFFGRKSRAKRKLTKALKGKSVKIHNHKIFMNLKHQLTNFKPEGQIL